MARGSRRRGKKSQHKLLISFIAFIMLGSGLFYGLRNSGSGEQVQAGGVSVRQVEVSPASRGAVPVKVEGILNQLVLAPENPGLIDSLDVERIVASNVTGVQDVEVEVSNTYLHFIFYTTDLDGVSERLRQGIDVPGGFKVHRMYYGSSQAGDVDLIGGDLKPGDTATAYLMARQSNGFQSVIGFVSGKTNETVNVDSEMPLQSINV